MINSKLGMLLLTFGLIACNPPKTASDKINTDVVDASNMEGVKTDAKEEDLIDKEYALYSNEDWAKVLTEDEYHILREKGTERPFTGKLLSNKETGTYVCAACTTPLFNSKTKFKSGTGWPSFYDKIGGNVKDESYGMVRTEVVCITCNGHLGHVFEDGPAPTGLRYCINSASLDFKK